MRLYFLLFVLTLAGFSARGQVIFAEDFDGIAGPVAGGAGTYAFPAGWRLVNVDFRSPNVAVGYVNQAWIRREDFANNVADSCAFSTSWTNPEGIADDWMWTPAINLPATGQLKLSWNAVAYDADYRDGYEVRIMTTAPTGTNNNLGNMVAASQLLYSNSAENSSWTTRSVDLSAYVGQTVYIGFRNNSNNKFLLLIDDVVVEASIARDVRVNTMVRPEYTLIPLSQMSGYTFKGTIVNNGTGAMSNVRLRAAIFRANTLVTTLNAVSVPSLASGASHSFETPVWAPAELGEYTIKLYPNTTETDEAPANDTMTQQLVVTDSVYARDNGFPVGSLGIGARLPDSYLGQVFELKQAASVKSVFLFFTKGYTGRKLAATIWNTDVNGLPTTLLRSTDTLLYPNDNAYGVSVPIFGGPVNLPQGKYLIAAIEFDSTLTLATTSEIFNEKTVFVKWPANAGGAWTPVENFGANFRRSFVLRLNLNENPLPVKIVSFSGRKTSTGNEVRWQVASQQNISRYEVEHSNNGVNFEPVGKVIASTLETDTYAFLDKNRYSGKSFYRLKVVERDEAYYSKIIQLSASNLGVGINLWPNPVSKVLHIEAGINQASAKESLIINAEGKIVKKFIINAEPMQVDVSGLPAGNYLLKVGDQSPVWFIKQ
ncbi:MAG: choice-of-anchor J domain-containing protein [Chitinophagaceae bacterium]|jgi:hypothetical protein|nr:choice-of-anchor J domain-containing protein [Chitinophagaceae bacterium]